MPAKGVIDKRRRIRALETRRDTLLQKQATVRVELAKVRAELKASRKKGN